MKIQRKTEADQSPNLTFTTNWRKPQYFKGFREFLGLYRQQILAISNARVR